MTKKTLTPGKYRALQKCTTSDGIFAVLALDHQDSLRRAIKPGAPDSLSTDDLIQFKMDVVGSIVSDATGVLLDPVYGAPQAVAQCILGHTGLLVELERADYQMNPLPLDVEIDPDWSVAKIKRMGADGVKLFFYYNPHKSDHAGRQDNIVMQVASECQKKDIPFYAEPIVYLNDTAESKRATVIEAARRTEQAGADVLKLEFPVDVAKETDESVWEKACAELTAAVNVPWVLLSAGVSYDMFTRQLEVACKAGASGFIVGRALWGNAATITHAEERADWLQSEGRKRFQHLRSIAEQYAQSWNDCYAPMEMNTDWFREYDEA